MLVVTWGLISAPGAARIPQQVVPLDPCVLNLTDFPFCHQLKNLSAVFMAGVIGLDHTDNFPIIKPAVPNHRL